MSFSRVSSQDKSLSSRRDLSLDRRVFHRDDTLWYSQNNDDPGSPMTVERLPFSTKRMISKFLRSKIKTNAIPKPGGRGRSGFETELPFFIDKNPTVDHKLQKRCENLNETITLLDSPRPNSVVQDQKSESVDVVDLCSESEDEQAIPQKKGKEKDKTELTKVVEEPKNDSLDVIVLDDDEESVSICRSKLSKDTNGKKRKTQAPSREKTNKAKRRKIDSVLGNNKSRSDGISGNKTVSNTKLNTIGTCSSDSNTLSLSSNVNPNNSAAITLSSSSKLANPTSTNDSLPSFIRKLNALDVSSKHLSENKNSNSRNALAQMDLRTPDFSNNVGSNIFNPNGNMEQHGLRPIIIDGCNVAIAHGGDRRFSVRGLCICVEYFLRRGHTEVLALVPLHQRAKVSFHDRNILDSLRNDKHLVFTPSRYIDNRLIASYDDRYIVQYAAAVGGVVVSKDNYRDLLCENPAWRDTILNRLLIPTWVGDMLMFPVDPMGKTGPTLDEFLRFPKI